MKETHYPVPMECDVCCNGNHGQVREEIVEHPPVVIDKPRDAEPWHYILGDGDAAIGHERKEHKQDDIENNAGFVVCGTGVKQFADCRYNPGPVAYQMHDGDTSENEPEPLVERDAGELWCCGGNKYAKHDAVNDDVG